jgi:DNA-binding CsgD family transcriptional regulator
LAFQQLADAEANACGQAGGLGAGGRSVAPSGRSVRARVRAAAPRAEAPARGRARRRDSSLREAARLAASLGAEPLLGEARALAGRARIQIDDEGAEETGNGFGLTEREREVLVLLSEGRSNPQIAGELFISQDGERPCLEHPGKVGVASRGEAAAVAHRHGLHRRVLDEA